MGAKLFVDKRWVGVPVAVVPLDDQAVETTRKVGAILEESFGVKVRFLDILALDPEFVRRISKQGDLKGTDLLEYLWGLASRRRLRLFAVTSFGLWRDTDVSRGSFKILGGIGSVNQVAILSQRYVCDVITDPNLADQWLQLITRHEFAHTCGINHHDEAKCIMNTNPSLAAGRFCRCCLKLINSNLAEYLKSPEAYWAKTRVIIYWSKYNLARTRYWAKRLYQLRPDAQSQAWLSLGRIGSSYLKTA